MPAGQQPGVLVRIAGFGLVIAVEHDAVGIEDVGTPARAGTGHDVVAEIGVERLAQIGQPEHGRVAGVNLQIVEHDPIIRIDRHFFGAEPILGILDVVGGDAGVFAHIDLRVAALFEGEFVGFQEDRVQRRAHAGGVEEFPFVKIDGPRPAVHPVFLIDGNIAEEGDGFGLEIELGGVGKHFQAVVALDFDRSAEAHSGFVIALDGAALIGDFEVFGHRRLG